MNPSTLCVGTDVHLDQLVLRAVDKSDGHEVCQRFHVPNNLPGAQAAATAIAQAATQGGYTRIEIAWEATGLLWVPFHRFLSTCPHLQPYEVKLVCFNPKLVAKFQGALVLREPKNDARDAWDVAARLRFGELPVSYVPSDFWQGLRRLTRYRYQLARILSREELRFESYAFLKASDWKRVKPFSDFFGATSVALLTEYTVAELSALTHDQLVDWIGRRGRGSFDDPAATARRVIEALRSSYPIDPLMDEMVTATLATSWEHIHQIQRLTARLDRQIARFIAPVPNPLLTVRGLGPVITAGLLAEIVDIARFAEHRHVAQYVGLTWPKRSSGAFVSQNSRMTKIGNVYLRYYFVLGADQLRRRNPEYQQYYLRKHQEVTTHQHKRALVLTARKLVRLVHALLTNNQPYARPQIIYHTEEAVTSD
jgi:transposase